MPTGYYDDTTTTYYSTSSATVWLSSTSANDTSATSGAATYIWMAWTQGTAATSNCVTVGSPFVQDTRTAEQRSADEARWARERAETQRRALMAEAKRKEARDKARQLLVAMLNLKQREQLARDRFFDVVAHGSKRRYRVHEGTHGNVRLLDDTDREVVRYCAQPNGVPTEDAMLAQKLQLEHDEDAFLRIANATRLIA